MSSNVVLLLTVPNTHAALVIWIARDALFQKTATSRLIFQNAEGFTYAFLKLLCGRSPTRLSKRLKLCTNIIVLIPRLAVIVSSSHTVRGIMGTPRESLPNAFYFLSKH